MLRLFSCRSVSRLPYSHPRRRLPCFFYASRPMTEKFDGLNKKIVDFGNNKQLDSAFAVYRLLNDSEVKITPTTASLLIEACGKCNSVDRAFSFFAEVQSKGTSPTLEMYNALIGVCAIGGQLKRANFLLSQMNEKEIKPNLVTFHKMFQLCSQSGVMESAMALLGNLSSFGIKPNTTTYNVLIRGFIKNNDPEKARNLHIQMKNENIEPNTETYAILIEMEAPDKAFEFLFEMAHQGIQPTVPLFNSFIAACGKAGDFENAMKLYSKMQEAKLKADRITFNILLASSVKAKRYMDTMELYDHMKGQKVAPNTATYNSLITRHCRIAELAEALELLTEMDTTSIPKNIATYNALFSGCVQQRDLNTAETLKERMNKESISPNAITSKYFLRFDNIKKELENKDEEPLVDKENEKKLVELDETLKKEAKDHLHSKKDEMMHLCDVCGLEFLDNDEEDRIRILPNGKGYDPQGDQAPFADLIMVLGDFQNLNKAFNVIAAMREYGMKINTRIYDTLIIACGKSEEPDRIEDVANIMADDRVNIEVNTYNAIILAYGYSQELEQAMKVLEMMNAEGDVTPNAQTYTFLLQIAVFMEADVSGPRTVEHILFLLNRSNVEWNAVLYNLVVAAHHSLKDYPKAIQTYNKMKAANFKADGTGIGAILTIASEKKDSNLVMTLMEDIDSMDDQAPRMMLRKLLTNFLSENK